MAGEVALEDAGRFRGWFAVGDGAAWALIDVWAWCVVIFVGATVMTARGMIILRRAGNDQR